MCLVPSDKRTSRVNLGKDDDLATSHLVFCHKNCYNSFFCRFALLIKANHTTSHSHSNPILTLFVRSMSYVVVRRLTSIRNPAAASPFPSGLPRIGPRETWLGSASQGYQQPGHSLTVASVHHLILCLFLLASSPPRLGRQSGCMSPAFSRCPTQPAPPSLWEPLTPLRLRPPTRPLFPFPSTDVLSPKIAPLPRVDALLPPCNAAAGQDPTLEAGHVWRRIAAYIKTIPLKRQN